MQKVHITDVMPGMKLAKAIFTSDGKVLITSGVELQEATIARLYESGIPDVYIEDGATHNLTISNDQECEKTREEAKLLAQNVLENYTFSSSTSDDKVRYTIESIVDELLSKKDILINLSDMKLVDDYTFAHSVNVCVLSLITGIGLGFNTSRLRDLGIGAILHDIGKLKVPEEILKKPSQLTIEEFEEIKKHTVYGYEILRNSKNVSMISAFIAFGHHERYDGSGYPLQLRGENIHQCARIVAVSDVYDALTSDRVYRNKMRRYEVIEYISSLSSHHFEKEIVDSFMKYIALYPVGTGVLLNTNERGIVTAVNRSMPTRPIVKIIVDRENKKVTDESEIDLARKLNTYVVDSCEIE